MPTVTRRRDPNASQEAWLIFYGDICVGGIAARTGNPDSTDPWQWRCGFYPGSNPGECTSGTAATFEQARREFETAWLAFLSKRTEADFEEWRQQRDWTARKYAAWERGEKVPARGSAPFARTAVGSAKITRTSHFC